MNSESSRSSSRSIFDHVKRDKECLGQSELNPVLGQCRVILQSRALPASGAEQLGAIPDHSKLFVRVGGFSRGRLHLSLRSAVAEAGQEDQSADVLLRLGDSVEVHADSLRCHADHLCLTLGVPEGSHWLAELLASTHISADDEFCNVHCRRCSQLLLEEKGKSSFILPTNMWQVSAEVLACEECMPLGTAHVRAARGRVYISAECLLVATSDLHEDALYESEDGFMKCKCGFVVGEASGAASSATRAGLRRPSARPVLNVCRQGWRSGGARRCASAAVSLYKHRVSMPRLRHERDVTDNHSAYADNVLAPYSEAAAVGAQLLSLRSTAGYSRFMLMPSKPSFQGRDDWQSEGNDSASDEGVPVVPSVASLELRILAPELLIIGPTTHCDAEAANADSSGTEMTDEEARRERVQRVAKVCFRRCSCDESNPNSCLVVVPHLEFEAVCQALDAWARSLPLSVSSASPLGAPGHGWNTSYVPLPPRDRGLC